MDREMIDFIKSALSFIMIGVYPYQYGIGHQFGRAVWRTGWYADKK